MALIGRTMQLVSPIRLALLVAKGGSLHRRSGMVFVYAMITMGVMTTGIAIYEVKWSSMLGGPLTAYMVSTGMAAVKPSEPGGTST